MGGRAAEELVFNHLSTGAGNDIERATNLARKMICEWGMGKMGPVSFGKKEEHIFLGREMANAKDYSEKTAMEIDEEIKEIVYESYAKALNILKDKRKELEELASALLEKESLNSDEIDLILGLKKTDPKEPSTSTVEKTAGAAEKEEKSLDETIEEEIVSREDEQVPPAESSS